MIHEINQMLSNPIIPIAGSCFIVVIALLLGRSEREAPEEETEPVYVEAFVWPPNPRRMGG